MTTRRSANKKRGKIRSAKQLGRASPVREPRASILIVCEGEKTEPTYFNSLRQHLRLHPVEIEVCGSECGSDPLSVVKYAAKRKKDREKDAEKGNNEPFDEIWCVFDTESVGHNPKFPDALQTAKAHKIKLAISNPCFEFWFLLHFDQVGSPFEDCPKVVKELKKNLQGYKKGTDVFQSIRGHTDEAVGRAETLMRSCWQHEDNPLKRNPSTEVHRLVQRLIEIVEKG